MTSDPTGPTTPADPAVPSGQPQGYPAYPQASDQQPYPVWPKTNTLAIVSLVSSFFVSLVAIITGHIALGQIKRRGEAGRGLALAGLIIGYVGIAATALFVVLAIAFAATFGAIIAAVAGGAAAPYPFGSDTSTEAPSEPDSLTGRLGAADFDAGYLSVGTGPTTVDVYFDPMCPYCKQFEDANGAQLSAAVDADAITLRLHALTFLDPASQGTDYSSRASAALTCQATLRPEATLDYLAALYSSQPAENTPGLTDDELVSLQGADLDFADCVASGRYLTWSQDNTKTALNGPIPGAEIDSIQGTPTVLVDGAQYQGPIDDPQAFADFLSGRA
ncbi:protein-disulfide isomerase [Cryobacterium sp. MP_M5]|uniref:DUF4190 domain-containing protein n=1 Tax=unclassified Cryobacterium TaxID=2649013 RepID=UPI0018CA81E7|nr:MULTISPECIES: thioredoxin domain-containing protein [unclassified Cryobacterium]MBG6059862.1 protein-disulfide isomerase [Cryobacterium sp. MP_M3]MEC5178234.1 protein-disulfide isomerase [Cryobacterium sp. MP_M5]